MPRKPKHGGPEVVVIGPESELSQNRFFKRRWVSSVRVDIHRSGYRAGHRFEATISQDLCVRGFKDFDTLQEAVNWARDRLREIVEESI